MSARTVHKYGEPWARLSPHLALILCYG